MGLVMLNWFYYTVRSRGNWEGSGLQLNGVGDRTVVHRYGAGAYSSQASTGGLQDVHDTYHSSECILDAPFYLQSCKPDALTLRYLVMLENLHTKKALQRNRAEQRSHGKARLLKGLNP